MTQLFGTTHPGQRDHSFAARQFLLLLLVVPFLIPLILIVRVSLESAGWGNYRAVFAAAPMFRFFANSLIIAVSTVVIVVALALCASYGLACLNLRGSSVIMGAVVAAMSLPVVALLVPLFVMIQRAQLFNTYFAVVLPLVAISLPFAILISTNFLAEIPSALVEAAQIDGAGSFRILVAIILPLARPIAAVVAVFSFIGAWNEYFLPLVFIQDTNMTVLTQVPTFFESQRHVDNPKVFAASVLISLPVVVVYILLQRLVRQGFAGGAIK